MAENSQKSNTNFDTLLGTFHTASALPYGSYTRTGSLPAQDPNTNVAILVTPTVGNAFFISFNQLQDTAVAVRVINEAQAISGVNGGLFTVGLILKGLSAAMDAYGNPPYSDAEVASILKSLRFIKEAVGQPAWRSYAEDFGGSGGDKAPVANFTVVDADGAGAGLIATITDTTTGYAYMEVWRIDETGATVTNIVNPVSPITHTFGTAGVKTISLYAMGPGGVSRITKTVTMA